MQNKMYDTGRYTVHLSGHVSENKLVIYIYVCLIYPPQEATPLNRPDCTFLKDGHTRGGPFYILGLPLAFRLLLKESQYKYLD